LITNGGKHIQITEKRHCSNCSVFTDQVCHKVRYHDDPDRSGKIVKRSYWVCPTCLKETEETKAQVLPSDKVKIIGRLLRLQSDYAIQSMNIASHPGGLLVEITTRD